MGSRRHSVCEAPVQLVLARLERVRETGRGTWRASCPCVTHARGDRNPSLSIRETESGGVLLYCFAGDPVEDIVAALGLEMADLYPAAPGPGESGRPRVPRIPWGDVFAALEKPLWVCSLAFADLSRGRAFSSGDAEALSRLAADLANTLSKVRHVGY